MKKIFVVLLSFLIISAAGTSFASGISVTAGGIDIDVNMPENYLWITADTDIRSLPENSYGEYYTLFDNLQPSMSTYDILLHAVKNDLTGQFVITPNHNDKQLNYYLLSSQVVLVNNLNEKDGLQILSSVSNEFQANSGIYKKERVNCDSFEILQYKPTGKDQLLISYVSTIGGISPAVEDEMDILVQSLPNISSPQNHQEENIHLLVDNSIFLWISISGIIAIILLTIVVFFYNKQVIRTPIDNSVALILRLKDMKNRNIITSSEYKEIKKRLS